MFDLFHDQMTNFHNHFFNIRHQYKRYQRLQTEMAETEALVHVDFAEVWYSRV